MERGPYGRGKALRTIVVTTDRGTLPERATWYLTTNLPAPGSAGAAEKESLPTADLAEIVRLYACTTPAACLLAGSTAGSACLAGALDHALALLERGSTQPSPHQLQAVLETVRQGYGIPLYLPP